MNAPQSARGAGAVQDLAEIRSPPPRFGAPVSRTGARLCRRPAAAAWQVLRLAFSTVALRFV